MPASSLLSIAQAKLNKSQIRLEMADFDRRLLQKAPPNAIFVCNQQLPGLDKWILLACLSEHFSQVQLYHPYPSAVPEALKPFTLKAGVKSLKKKGFRIRFPRIKPLPPSEEVAIGLVLHFSDNPISVWGNRFTLETVLRQLRHSGQPIIPVRLQTIHRPGGLLRKALPGLPYSFTPGPLSISVRVGNAIQPEDVALLKKNRVWGRFLQAKIFSLGSPFDIQPEQFTPSKTQKQQPIALPIDNQIIVQEISALPTACTVASRGQFEVIIASFEAIPNTLLEIGRLRELTFRTAGEGSGKSRDMDEHDLYYLQLIIWDKEQQQIAGGYRLGLGDRIFEQYGVNGFYTHSLFKMKPEFYPLLQKSVELGRTYITDAYQKHRLPLFLLWKGILHFLLANPQYQYLLGPVSISKDYSDASKGVIVAFVKHFFYNPSLANLVSPRKAFRPKIKSVDTGLLAQNLKGEFDALEKLIETIEPTHCKVPVLFKQYLRQNARFIAFNVDPKFSNCLDGLMMLDIQQLPESTIEALQQEK